MRDIYEERWREIINVEIVNIFRVLIIYGWNALVQMFLYRTKQMKRRTENTQLYSPKHR
jgi:hypothetical protein